MPEPKLAQSRSRAKRWLPVIMSLLAVVVAFSAMRALDAPWSGHTGQLIFAGKAPLMGAMERYQEVWRCYLDKAHPAREKFELRDWINVGLWCGSVFALMVAVVVAISAPWWGRAIRRPDAGEVVLPPPPLVPRWSILVLVIAMLLGAYLRVQTIQNAPFWDEQDNMRRNFHGYVEYRGPDQTPVWKPAGFEGAIWENTRGNNPYLYSLLSQMSHKIWRAASGASEQRCNVIAMRLPSVICGVLAIAAIWWSMNRMGLARTAPWGALLLSVHGLAIEFSVEARGYGVAMLTSAMLLGLAWSAIERGRAAVWLAYGAALFCSLLAYPGSLYLVVCLNLLVACVLAWRGIKQRDPLARCGLARWTLTNTITATLYFWLLAPAMPQAAMYYASKFPTADMGVAWNLGFYITYASGLCAIFSKDLPDSALHGGAAWAWFSGGFWKSLPLALWCVVVFPPMFLAGCVKNLRMPGAGVRVWLLAVCLMSGPLMIWLQPRLTKDLVLYFWYIIFITPAVLVLAATGISAAGDGLAARMKLPEARKDIPSAVLALCAVLAMLAISSSVVSRQAWDDGYAGFSRKPVTNAWQTKPGMIPYSEIVRGKNNWVNYADGYLVAMLGYDGNAAAWAKVFDRPMAQWGKGDAPLKPARAK